MVIENRIEQFQKLFPAAPTYRWRQVEAAFFDAGVRGWASITTLPKDIRLTLAREMPWISICEVGMYESKNHDTWKAILKGRDGQQFESVLMANRHGQWTICVSSQVGCAMRCTFCATGAMGLKRSLMGDEIIDQYRFWRNFLVERPALPPRISNIVFMGMGEPMANYDNVKAAIHTWLEYTDLGSTHITVSTVGVLSQLEKLLDDPDWPRVRIAISLHSANQKRRESIVPTTTPDFLDNLADWSKRYHQKYGSRKLHITYEYTLLQKVNDEPEHARELAKYIRRTGVSKINVIPYNPVVGKSFTTSQRDRIDKFKELLRTFNLNVTERRTMGDDIAAACGQLAIKKNK
ncbi:MAG: 23S rRNA (adenine(2503)-C(2))-methyltransferase RlmN [Candidatus Magasanikbacteria bacterium]|nr:23S rRNA (adenine(2503)-C(2))-methyltransferase RlmN [Candidatus Magasanikbacteria bacterium]